MLAFIGTVAAFALYAAQKPTLGSGPAMAASLLEQNKIRGWKTMECEDQFRIEENVGAEFVCTVELTDGDRAKLEMHLGGDGMIQMRVLDTSHPEHAHIPPKADPWD